MPYKVNMPAAQHQPGGNDWMSLVQTYMKMQGDEQPYDFLAKNPEYGANIANGAGSAASAIGSAAGTGAGAVGAGASSIWSWLASLL